MSTTTPAGWYPDPHNQAAQRYWDGVQWTQHVSGGPPPPTYAAPQPGYAGTQAAYQQPMYVQPQPAVFEGMVLAGWWSRVGASIIDSLILLIPAIGVGVLVAAAMSPNA